MSLKAWYHFISDAKNYGLGDLDLNQVTTPTFVSNGKIGSTCLNTGSFKWTADQTASVLNNNELTIAFWIKVTGTSGGILFGNDGMVASNNRKFTLFQYPTANDLHWSWMNDTASTTFVGGSLSGVLPTNGWTHCCLTYKNPVLKVYINGTLAATQTGVSSSASFAYETTVLHNNGGRCVQDFRVYDNALSTKEVKLLSQGLVAHYQLKGMGRTNYLKGAGQFTKDNPLIRNSNDSSAMNDSYVYHNGVLSVTVPAAGTYTWVLESDGVPTEHPTSGTVATSRYFSMWLQNTSTGDHYLWGSQGTGVGGEKYGSVTIPAGTYNVRTNLYAADKVNYQVKFWNMKLVQGTYDTNDIWCPHTEDELYSNLGLGLATEADCSGYGNHGEKNTAFEVVNGSPRHGTCYRFAGSQYINCGRGTMVKDALTVSCWAYSDNWTNFSSQRLMSCTESGGWNFEPNGTNGAYPHFAVGTGTSSCTYQGATANVTLASLTGWHMFTGTYDGYTTKIYIDGVLRGTNNAYSSKTPIFYNATNSLFIGAEATLSATTPGGSYFIGNISDVRIYGTALSATDIEELYRNAASLTKDGKLLAYDFRENKRNTIDKDGVVATGGFNDKSIPTYDMKVKALDDGSTWARIHHLDVTSDKKWFANASEVAKCLDKHNRYSRMGIVGKYKSGSEYEFMLTYPSMKKSIPAGYTQLEYIEATGTQYINTGVTGAARWEFDIEFKTGIPYRQLMGYGGNGQEYWGVQVHCGYGVHEDQTLVGVAAGQRDTIVHSYGENSNYSIWVQNKSVNVNSGTDVATKEYQLFCIMSNLSFACHAKLYRCRCVKGGSLVRDFIPAMRNSDGAIGLIDVVNNVFYGNAGSGVFYCNYTWLDWLQSSGTQYINTGFIPNSNTRIVIKAMLTSPYSIYGVNQSGANFNMTGSSSNGGVMYYYWGGAGASTMTNMYDEVHTFEQNKNVCYVDGNLYHTYTASTWAATVPIFLFGRNNGSLNDAGTVRIYECQIYDNDTLVRDMVPCLNGSTPGMYDRVNKTFYSNAGSGTFRIGYKAGSYQWLDYIQNTGVEYINTGYPAPEGFISEAVIEYASTSGGGYVLGSHNISEPWGRNGYGLNGNGYFEIGTGDTCPASSFKVSANTRYTIKASTIKGNSYMDVNGSRAISTSDSSARCVDNVYVFSNQYSRHNNANNAPFRLYSLKFWLPNGTLIRDFVPCVSPSGQVGLYDKVTKRFFGNSGSGYLIAGTTQESLPLYNRWTQNSWTTDVNQGDNITFKPITTSWPAHSGPIKPSNTSSCLYDCDNKSTGNWYAPVGQYTIWETGIPAADGTAQSETELWVRTDRFTDEDQLNIYNGSITAMDYIEI